MTGQIIFTAITGIVFLVAMFVIGCLIAFRTNPTPIPREAMFIFRVILAIAAAGFGTSLSGFIEIDGEVLGWQFRAAGSLAVFVAVYLVNPPSLVKKRKIPSPAGSGNWEDRHMGFRRSIRG